MDEQMLVDDGPVQHKSSRIGGAPQPTKKKSRRGADPANQKRRCVSTACVACRKRKSKCDGALPSCAACASVYGTECVYNPNTDHRRKGVYREKVDSMKAQSSTLQILIEAILNAAEDDVPAIVKKIRTCDSLDTVAEAILKDGGIFEDGEEEEEDNQPDDPEYTTDQPIEGERDLARKMGELRVENGAIRFIGGTSHLIYQGDPSDILDESDSESFASSEDPLTSWSEVIKDRQLIIHLINMYFSWHYPYFTTLSKSLFYRDFLKGKPRGPTKGTVYCSSLLINAMLALGCHFTSISGAFAIAGDSRTKGDHFFAECKRLIVENDEYEKPRLVTVQALALMSVREAGCGREAKGWVYSGMSFRMAQDIGLNFDAGGLDKSGMSDQEIDARRVSFWGCFLFDKCWSNYLGRLPQLPKNSYNVPKYDVFPEEDAEAWSPYTDEGFDEVSKQPSRTRAAGLQLSKLCEISSDLLLFFYHPNHIGRSSGKAVELKNLSELHRRLEDWRKELPKEFEPREGQLPNVILMHMFFHLQYIHLFRPFLKYLPSASPLPTHVSPRRICTANAGAISKLMRLYKKVYDLRQICNIAVYMVHSAVTIHMLNLPEKTARRDVTHGVRHLEEIAEDWLCARRSLSIISVLARKWRVDLPDEAAHVLLRTDEKYGTFSTSDVPSPSKVVPSAAASPPVAQSPASSLKHNLDAASTPPGQFNSAVTPPLQIPDSSLAALPPELLSTLAGTTQMPRQPVTLNGINGGNDTQPAEMSLSDAAAMASLDSWVMPSGIASPLQTPYHQSFAPPTSSPASAGPAVAAAPTARQVSPNTLFAIDGQDWYLKDAVGWQQNFEAWGMGGGGGVVVPGQAAGMQQGQSQSPVPRQGQAAPVSGMTDPSMYVFRGGAEGFDLLGNSMSGLDSLTGLD